MRFTDRICLYPGRNFLRLGCVWEETWWERTAIRSYWHLQEAVSVPFFLSTPIIFRTSRSSIPIISELPSCRDWQAVSGLYFLYPLLCWSAQFFFIKNKTESYIRKSPLWFPGGFLLCDNVIIFYIKFFAFSKNRAILNTEKCSCKSMKHLRKIICTPGIEIKTPKVYITTQEE